MSNKPILPIEDMMPIEDGVKQDLDPRPLYWQRLSTMDLDEVCSITGAKMGPGNNLSLKFIGNQVVFQVKERQMVDDEGNPISDFLSEMVTLLYLVGKDSDSEQRQGLQRPGEPVSPLQLPTGATFFRGPHVIPTAQLEEGFGDDAEGFLEAGKSLGGSPWSRGDASFRLMVLPYIEMCLILYTQDEEFPARVNLLVSDTIDHYLSLDAVWGLCSAVVKRLLKEKFG